MHSLWWKWFDTLRKQFLEEYKRWKLLQKDNIETCYVITGKHGKDTVYEKKNVYSYPHHNTTCIKIRIP